MIGGWATDGIVQLQSGLPMTPQHTGDVGSMGTNQALRPDLVCNPNLPRGEQTIEKFFRTECLALQTPMRYGTAGRAVITGPGRIGIDLSLRKDFHVHRAERICSSAPSSSTRSNPPTSILQTSCWVTQTLAA